MKKLLYILLLLPMIVVAQSSIKTTTYKTATTVSVINPAITVANEEVTYLDGFGRPIQQVAGKQSNTGKNVVKHIEYDAFGRQQKRYLPYISTTANLNYDTTGEANTLNFYSNPTTATTGDPNFEATSNPYSETVFENSPLNRVLESAAQGNDWVKSNNHTVKISYEFNVANEVKSYSVVATWNTTTNLYDIPLTDNGYYAANLLYKTITKNENWTSGDGDNNTTQKFKNNEGQLILKRTFNNSVAHDTYYIHDQFGNLAYTISPSVDTTISLTTTVLDNLCYQYKYDNRNRLVEKKLPGKQWEFIVYDKLNRPVASGPSFSPFTNLQTVLPAAPIVGWLIVKYDVYNRPIYTGWMQATTVDSTSRNLLQVAQNSATTINESKTAAGAIDGIGCFYTNSITPTSFKLLSVNYYDNYNFPNAPAVPATVENQTVLGTTQVKRLPTGSWIRALTTTAAIIGETSTVFYDTKVRPIRSYTTNYLTGFSQTDSKLDFMGKTLYTIATHKRTSGSQLLTLRDEYTYSPQDRLLLHLHQINGGVKQLLESNSYNEFGQLISKKVGGTDQTGVVALQNIDYSYNIRGWLKSINDVNDLHDPLSNPAPVAGNAGLDMFAFKINYNTVDNTSLAGVMPLYNGNISETSWRTISDNKPRSYGYSFDHLNRLTNAQYIRPTLSGSGNVEHSFDETLSYDKNGNIQSLQRNGGMETQSGFNQIDNLTYSYNTNNPNQLIKVDDSTNDADGFKDGINFNDDYAYDAEGNMIKDENKGIQYIKYNHLNLPTEITFTGTNRKINYIYTASGQKLQKTVNDGVALSTTDYIDGFQYNNSDLQFFPHSEGYVKNTIVSGANSYDYVYSYTDHLGNIRLNYGLHPITQELTKFEENNYYPFGLKHATYNYTFKEIQEVKELKIIQEAVAADPIRGIEEKLEIKEEVFEKKPVIREEEYFEKMAALKNAQQIVIYNANLVPNSGYQYKFQNQERQDELDLNWDSFKWRNYDPATGRFMSIDKLTEKYHHWSPYVFGGNQVVHSRELEGLEPEDDLCNDERQNYNSENHGVGFDGEMTDHAHYQDAFPMNGELNEVIVGGGKGSGGMERPDLDGDSYDRDSDGDREQKERALEDMASNFQNIGAVVSLVGVALSLTVVGAPLGATLMALGSGLSWGGVAIEFAEDAFDGHDGMDWGNHAMNIGSELIPGAYDDYFGSADELMQGADNLYIELIANGSDFWMDTLSDSHKK